MEKIIEEITKLTDEWRSLTGKGHCKDRDFHWYIETKWSYGNSPVYLVVHYGYIIDEINEPCATYEDALKTLKNILEKEIREYRSYLTQDDES